MREVILLANNNYTCISDSEKIMDQDWYKIQHQQQTFLVPKEAVVNSKNKMKNESPIPTNIVIGGGVEFSKELLRNYNTLSFLVDPEGMKTRVESQNLMTILSFFLKYKEY